jgi:hypothetical protein
MLCATFAATFPIAGCICRQAILILASSGVVEASESIARRSFALRKTKNPRMRRATQSEGYTA